MTPPFPQELWDPVIDEMRSNVANLRACSLVRRTWQSRSQRHLFNSLALFNAASVAAFREIIERSSAIATYVRHLLIQDSDYPTQKWAVGSPSEMRSILLKLVNVQSLDLDYLDVKAIFQAGIGPETFPLLKKLHMRGLRCAEPATLASILLLMPRLEKVSLNRLRFSSPERLWNPDIPATERKPFQLRSLHLNFLTLDPPRSTEGNHALGMQLGRLFAKVDRVAAFIYCSSDIATIGGLVASLGSSLCHLGLHAVWEADRDYDSLNGELKPQNPLLQAANDHVLSYRGDLRQS